MVIEWEVGWELISRGITKLKRIMEGLPGEREDFTCEESMMLYTLVYHMCTQKRPHDHSQKLFDKYRETIEEYLDSTVLPSLREKHNELLLRDFVRRWENHMLMISWMSRFFNYLDRYFIINKVLPSLKKVGLSCFHDLVYKEVKVEVEAAVVAVVTYSLKENSLSDQERKWYQVERAALLENVQRIIVEMDKDGRGRLADLELE